MAATGQIQSTATEDQVRGALVSAFTQHGAQFEANMPGSLVMDLGSVGAAWLAGPFRSGMKMPVRIAVTTAGGPGGTGISIEVASRGTGGGFMSGGVFGASKQRKAEQAWLQMALAAVPSPVGAPAGGPPPPPPVA